MRTLLFTAVVAVAIGFAHFAGAQTTNEATLPESATMMQRSCVANGFNPSECACMTGFYSGRLAPEEFRLLAVLNGFLGPNGQIGDMPAAQQALRAESARLGMSDQRFEIAMQRFSTLQQDGAYADRVCMALRNP